ncbi:MAG: HD domain-containing protein [Eubacteriaceae bacterium]|nr:HD domain-containing protein [Eubacteriaceae bacterium]
MGSIACQSVFDDLKTCEQTKILADWDKIKEVFLLACLLHDVGHAPFSHTGEKYYLDDNGGYALLHQKLADVVGTDSFRADIPRDSMSAAPHEIMSAIVALENFRCYLSDDFSKELFARCITGYQYKENELTCSALNCVISMLNSKVIDVDRLDYLIRDAYFTGFETVNIDYLRLLRSLTVIVKGNVAKLGFNKNAISVIENVVYAHDAERKWIQTHPIVLYDMYIIRHVIDALHKAFSTEENKLFSLESLSVPGHRLQNGMKMCLLCDDDIVHLLKQKLDDRLCAEFFSRKDRRHPLWKSEAEYNAYLTLQYGADGKVFEALTDALSETEKYMYKNSDSWIINEDVIRQIESDLEAIKQMEKDVDPKSLESQEKSKEKILKVVQTLKTCADKNGLDCDFVLLEVNRFYSGFNKEDLLEMPIKFPEKSVDNTFSLKDLIKLLESGEEKNDKRFFYLYYQASDHPIDKAKLCAELYKAFMP